MQYREATHADIQGMQVVRNAVRENRLSDPSIVKDEDYTPYLQESGKSWVCLDEEKIVAFAIVDHVHHNIWALFVLPRQ